MSLPEARLLCLFLVTLLVLPPLVQSQEQDPFAINGGSILAMTGKNSVAVAVDKRFGSGPQVGSTVCMLPREFHCIVPLTICEKMVNVAPRHVWIPQPSLMVAFVGLDGDVQSVSKALLVEVSNKLNRALGFEIVPTDGINQVSLLRRITPQALASLTSHVLYQNRGRFYVQPLIVGLKERTGTPYLCGMDSIGAQSLSSTFVCSGAASTSLYGTAEALWKPDLEPEELVEATGKAFQSALERDCLSGYGALVYLITKDGITEYDLASRND